MPNTTNFNWVTPADTDLVKDGAAAIRTLGNGIDTSLVDLKGGTTGQVLSKATNADLDFSWTTPTDQTPLTTKGDLFTFTTVDARLGVGANGTVLTADSAEATGLKWAIPASGGMTLLASGSLGTGTAVNLTSISQSYEDLVLRIYQYQSTTNNPVRLRVNADDSGRYATSTSTSPSNISMSNTSWNASATQHTGSTNFFAIIYFPDYTSSTVWRRAHGFNITNNTTTPTNANHSMVHLLYNQTTAITELNILPGDGENFVAGSYELWGVK